MILHKPALKKLVLSLIKKQPSRNNGGSLQLDKEHLLGNLWWDDSVSKVVGKKNVFGKLRRKGQLVMMSIRLPREHLGMLFMLQKRKQKNRSLDVSKSMVF